jgi:hypothetical protein
MFRRTINNYVARQIEKEGWYIPSDPNDVLYRAFANISPARLFLQLLVNSWCTSWAEHGFDAYQMVKFDQDTLKSLPVAFLIRVMRGYKELSKLSAAEKAKEWCYRDHEGEENGLDDCGKEHTVYNEDNEHKYLWEA